MGIRSAPIVAAGRSDEREPPTGKPWASVRYSRRGLLAGDQTVWLLVLPGEDYSVGGPEHAMGTIVVSEAYELSIDDVAGPETDEQTTAFVFTVRLSAPVAWETTVDYATADGITVGLSAPVASPVTVRVDWVVTRCPPRRGTWTTHGAIRSA